MYFKVQTVHPKACIFKDAYYITGENMITGGAYSGTFNSPQVMFQETSHLPGIKELFLELMKCEIFRKPHTCVELKWKPPQLSWLRLSLIVFSLGTQL